MTGSLTHYLERICESFLGFVFCPRTDLTLYFYLSLWILLCKKSPFSQCSVARHPGALSGKPSQLESASGWFGQRWSGAAWSVVGILGAERLVIQQVGNRNHWAEHHLLTKPSEMVSILGMSRFLSEGPSPRLGYWLGNVLFLGGVWALSFCPGLVWPTLRLWASYSFRLKYVIKLAADISGTVGSNWTASGIGSCWLNFLSLSSCTVYIDCSLALSSPYCFAEIGLKHATGRLLSKNTHCSAQNAILYIACSLLTMTRWSAHFTFTQQHLPWRQQGVSSYWRSRLPPALPSWRVCSWGEGVVLLWTTLQSTILPSRQPPSRNIISRPVLVPKYSWNTVVSSLPY